MILRIATFCSKRPLSTSSTRKSVVSRIRDFVFATEKENFDQIFVERAHKWDQISRVEWKLIYRDLGASRAFLLVSTLLPISLVGAVVLLVDRLTNSRQEDRMPFVRKIERDFKELGALAVFPVVAVVLVVALLLRVHRIRLLRIYQNRADVDSFLAVRSELVVRQKQSKFHRDECGAFYYNEDKELQKLAFNFLFGNIQIGKRKYMVLDECFIGNNYRSYMLNETSMPPRLMTQPPK